MNHYRKSPSIHYFNLLALETSMKTTSMLASLALLFFAGCAGQAPDSAHKGHHMTAKAHHQAHHKAHWGYSGAEGPAHWGELDPKYAACKSGKSQSPINITGAVEADLPALEMNYSASGKEVINNGHTIQVNVARGNSLTIGDKQYELLQYHFHTSSENTIEGESFALEMHLVHRDSQGNLAVVGVMFEEGEANDEIANIWSVMPQEQGSAMLNEVQDPTSLLPADQSFNHFMGSLTTPPCTEGVNWYVLNGVLSISSEQKEAFLSLFGENNNRPVQPLNGREIQARK